jgi:hypothetical protein
MVILGHADRTDDNMLSAMKDSNKNLKIDQWLLDQSYKKRSRL